MSETKISNFKDALSRFNESVTLYTENINSKIHETFRDSMIQRFEFTYELAWKCLAEYMEKNKIKLEYKFPKAILRESFLAGIINDEVTWVNMHDARNLLSHTYKVSTAKELAKPISTFFNDALNALGEFFKKEIV